MADGDRADEALPWADESPFARGVDGFYVRYDDEPALAELEQPITDLRIDGEPVENWLPPGERVMRATLLTDGLGQPVRRRGRLVARPTTIYDVLTRIAPQRPTALPVPVLCHQPHLRPVAVCRVCSVLIQKKNDRRPPAKLFPACQHHVEADMRVHTANSRVQIEWIREKNLHDAGELVRGMVRTLTELLVTDHLPNFDPQEPRPDHELWTVARQVRVPVPRRFPLPLDGAKARPAPGGGPAGPRDDTSAFIGVDHAACILCDRCSRGCADVRNNNVIGRTGKGYFTRVGFDLDTGMGAPGTSCVNCGECAVWCPTDALTIKKPATISSDPNIGGRTAGTVALPRPVERPLGPVAARELREHELFGRLPFKLLDWVRGSVVRRALDVTREGGVWKRDVLFREGQYGSSAFLLESGTLKLSVEAPVGGHRSVPGARGWWDWGRGRSIMERLPPRPVAETGRPVTVRTDAGLLLTGGHSAQLVTFDPAHRFRFLGDAACLSNYPYGSTATAVEPSVVLEIRKNVLLALLRHPDTRRLIRDSLRETALVEALHKLIPRTGRPGRARTVLAEELARRAEYSRAFPGDVVYRQGDEVTSCAYVRAGFVRLTRTDSGAERHDYVGPGGVLGPDSLAATHSGTPTYLATATALDNVELLQFPVRPELRDAIRAARPSSAAPRPEPTPGESRAATAENRGFFNLLVLDLDKCTRCDECTRACAATHKDGVTRLIREGLREGSFLVATSCRSCLDTRCTVGCPVDAIHRRGDLIEVRIEEHCIGCGLCEANCPYGNIRMVPPPDGNGPRVAVTCDLCRNRVGENEPNCVYACPHDAAHRTDDETLRGWVAERRNNS